MSLGCWDLNHFQKFSLYKQFRKNIDICCQLVSLVKNDLILWNFFQCGSAVFFPNIFEEKSINDRQEKEDVFYHILLYL